MYFYGIILIIFIFVSNVVHRFFNLKIYSNVMLIVYAINLIFLVVLVFGRYLKVAAKEII